LNLLKLMTVDVLSLAVAVSQPVRNSVDVTFILQLIDEAATAIVPIMTL